MNELIVGIGEVLWDMLPQGRQIGGAPANFAHHVSQFGQPACVISAVGDDALGREIIDSFASQGLDSHLAIVDRPTGTVDVLPDTSGRGPQYEIHQGVAWDYIPWTPALEAIASQTRAVCFGSLAQRCETSRETIGRFLDAVPRDDNRLVVFDINLRQDYYSKDIIEESLRRCNILKINNEELATISGMFGLSGTDVQDDSRQLLTRFGLKMLILTCGAVGSYVFTRDGVSFRPTPRVEVADTVGAGDSFTAAFIAALLRGRSVADAHAAAVRASAYVCTCHGATPVLPASVTSLDD